MNKIPVAFKPCNCACRFKLSLATRKQKSEIDHRVAYDSTHTLLATSGTFWSRVNRRVSHYALAKAHSRFAVAQKLSSATGCTGSFSRTFGIPCSHTLRKYLDSNRHLDLSEFHDQWRVKRDKSSTVLQRVSSRDDVGRVVSAIYSEMAPRQQHDFAVGLQVMTQTILATQVLEPEPARSKGRPPGARTSERRQQFGTLRNSSALRQSMTGIGNAKSVVE